MTTATDLVEYEAPEEHQAIAVKSPGDFRTESVGRALDAAYSKASTLELTPEEAKALAEDFPDEAFRLGAGGDPDLIYIEHAYLRRRLNHVLGVGASVPIRRREWSEEFTYYNSSARKEMVGIRIYVDLVLIVRGCVVSEAIGDAVYYPHNAKTNYSDALESAKSNAFRRCCKEFGIGLQAWIKGWGEGWKERNCGANRTQTKPAQQSQAKQDRPPQSKPNGAQNFTPPPGWPDTPHEGLVLWCGSLKTAAAVKTALGMFAAEEPLQQTISEWEPVLNAVAAAYKRVTANFTKNRDTELEQEIAAKLQKLELDKQSVETFQATEEQHETQD